MTVERVHLSLSAPIELKSHWKSTKPISILNSINRPKIAYHLENKAKQSVRRSWHPNKKFICDKRINSHTVSISIHYYKWANPINCASVITSPNAKCTYLSHSQCQPLSSISIGNCEWFGSFSFSLPACECRKPEKYHIQFDNVTSDTGNQAIKKCTCNCTQ